MALTIGTKLGPYEIVALLGAGGMGEVYRARDVRLDRTVAVKKVREAFSNRFDQEARAIAAMNHPHICTLYDIGPDFIVMEYVEGKPLRGPVAVEEAVVYAVQIADALSAAHRKGVIHRDLKPGNILVTSSGVKLLDFGLAKMSCPAAVGDETLTLELTQPGMIVGTPQYMAPEQIEGKPADARSDIFSFGSVLYEMLTGKPAFSGSSIPGLMAAILHEQPTSASNVRPGIPTDLDRLIARCLQKAPAQRFGSMEEVKTALEKASLGQDARASIAVLPFANLSADRENEYFGDGLAEEIINALTQVPGLRVIARTSAFAFKGKQEDARRISETLGVANILDGSVRRAGNRIRVTAQLITAADGSHLWADRYDREMTDVFAVQDEIAQAVVDALKEHLGASAAVRRVQRQAADIEAYHLYVKGRHYFWKFTPEGLDTARDLFEQAVSVDPNYALPLVELAHYYFLKTMTGSISASEGAPLGIKAAEKALTLDPTLGEAVGVRALLWGLYEYRWGESLQELQRAIQMNPASALTPHWRAIILTGVNRLSEAVSQQEQALKADPLLPLNHYFLARLLVSQNDYDRAFEQARLVVEIAPDYWLGHTALGLVHLRGDNPADAIRELQWAQLGHYSCGWRGSAHVLAGERDKAQELLRQIENVKRGRYVSSVPAAMIYTQLGEVDAAFAHLELAIVSRDFQLYALQTDPMFDKLRPDPRYKDLLRRMKLA
jgi:TolB-like protein/predicted Ser/Thr protein kinase